MPSIGVGLRLSAPQLGPISAALALAKSKGDGGAMFFPGVASATGAPFLPDSSLTPTAGTLGPDSVTRPAAAWLAAYVESTASTPASVDGPVGFLSDGEGTAGPNVVTTYNNSAGWSVSAGVITATAAGAYSTSPGNAFSTGFSAGDVVKVTLSATVTAGSVSVQLYGSTAQNVCNMFASGTVTQIATVQAGGAVVGNLQAGGSGFTGAVTAVSVQKLTGRHATQNSGPNKPLLRRGLVNGLVYSSDFTNVAWGKVGTAPTANAATAPDGTLTASVFTSTATGDAYINQQMSSNGPVCFVGVFSRAGGNQSDSVSFRCITFATAVEDDELLFNLTTKVFTGTGTIPGRFLSYGYIDLPNGNVLLYANNAAAAGQTASEWRARPEVTGSGSVVGKTIGVWRGGIIPGTLTAAQILAAGGIPLTTTIAASGTGGNYALEFGGSVTQLQALFAPTNAATVVLAVRVNSFAGTPVLVGQAAGGLQVYINSGGGVQAGIAGGANFGSANGVITAGAVYVISVRIAVNGTSTIRVNGVVVATSTAITAAMNQTTISIGSNGSSNFTGGLFGPVLLYTSVLNDAETLVLERGAGALAPITGVKF